MHPLQSAKRELISSTAGRLNGSFVPTGGSAFVASCMLLFVQGHWAVSVQTTSTPASSAPVATQHAAANTDQDPLAIFRPTLLREGSHLVEARSTMRRDPANNQWILDVDDADVASLNLLASSPTTSSNSAAPVQGSGGGLKLILLPCTVLSEMQHVLESSASRKVSFEVTGEVHVFRGRNYILPTHAPAVVGSRIETPVAAAASTQPSSTNLATTRAATSSAQDIIRDLERSAGAIPQRASSPQLPEPAGIEPRPSANAAADSHSPSGAAAAKIVQEGVAVSSRRGKLNRDGAGGWVFVFDADASGLADPPMRLLPCLLLEALEDYARKSGPTAPVLLSGQVFLHGGRNYLLPTSYRIPREHTKITP
jgi:hypothetical protein